MRNDLDDRLTERDAQLTRFASRYPAEANAVVNALSKVRYYKGEPDEFTCACGSVADEWQLVILADVEGPAFLPYSEDPDDYQAFCTPCALDVCADRLTRLNAWRFEGGN
ncbi:hypothetical protein FM076_18700 [Streptomyces albus subsp. chlorinus]|uniref:hypothetical protein n=1 Tax=Streptomyces albus TaxID=1888 RepID=UPI00156F969B|nr:hypothetical protein [Streptomyces albus]NSC23075.1 hypothetical protein [Streptomyces albus subsp. chlorinus]